MIRQMVVLMWVRWRKLFLNVSEICFCTIAVFILLFFGLRFVDGLMLPMGFDINNLWSVEIDRLAEDEWDELDAARILRILRETKGFDQVTAAALASGSPYGEDLSMTVLEADGVSIMPQYWTVSKEFDEVMGLHLSEGRWFDAGDEALPYRPVVVTEELRSERFGSVPAIGEVVGSPSRGRESRVIGIIESFRHEGELSEPPVFLFYNYHLESGRTPVTTILVKTTAGVDTEFEIQLVALLQRLAPDWSFTFQSIESKRQLYLRRAFEPLAIGGVLTGFLVFMVALGLVGVLWQSVVQRTREFGLRRAVGARRSQVFLQIIAEMFLVSALGIAIALVFIFGVSMFGFIPDLDQEICTRTGLASMVIVFILTGICASYPAWIASNARPAEALHWD